MEDWHEVWILYFLFIFLQCVWESNRRGPILHEGDQDVLGSCCGHLQSEPWIPLFFPLLCLASLAYFPLSPPWCWHDSKEQIFFKKINVQGLHGDKLGRTAIFHVYIQYGHHLAALLPNHLPATGLRKAEERLGLCTHVRDLNELLTSDFNLAQCWLL